MGETWTVRRRSVSSSVAFVVAMQKKIVIQQLYILVYV